MTIILDAYTIPEKGQIELNVKRSFEIKVTAKEAHQRVKRWLRQEVSYLLGADQPNLVVGENIIWQVPAWIGFPHTGRVGVVGFVAVDVKTGEIYHQRACKAKIEYQAEQLAKLQPPYRPKDETPEQYLAKHITPAPVLQIQENGVMVLIISSTRSKQTSPSPAPIAPAPPSSASSYS